MGNPQYGHLIANFLIPREEQLFQCLLAILDDAIFVSTIIVNVAAIIIGIRIEACIIVINGREFDRLPPRC